MTLRNGALFAPGYELFDAARHKIEEREIGLSYGRESVREVSLAEIKARYPDAEYPCAMRSLMPGEFDIGWGEKLRVMPEDVAMCVVNGNAIAKDDSFPLLFDHAFTARGTERAGGILECYEEGGAFWHVVDLADEEMYRAACKPGKRWKARSLGFGAWIDSDGFLRPVQPKELSLTNLPRMKGLGNVVEMSNLKKALGIGFGRGPAGMLVPNSPAPVPSAPPEGAQNVAAGGGASLSQIPSPDPASNRKEEHMKVSPETMKLLGLAPDASEDDFNARLAERLAPKPAPVPAPEATPPHVPTVSLADVQKIVADATAAVFKDLADTNAKAIAEATAAAEKKARVDGVLAEAIRLGKMRKADLDLYRPSVEANPEAFSARLSTMPNVAPVERFYQAGGTGAPGGEFHGYDTPAAYGRAIGDTVAALGCSVSAAIDIVNAGGVAAGEEN